MRADVDRAAGCFIGKADDEVLRRVVRGRQSFASRELFDEFKDAAFRRTVAFTRDALAIAIASDQALRRDPARRGSSTACAQLASTGSNSPGTPSMPPRRRRRRHTTDDDAFVDAGRGQHERNVDEMLDCVMASERPRGFAADSALIC